MEINTCNVFYCDGFTLNSKNKPSIWTENWNGWFFAFVGAIPYETLVIYFFSLSVYTIMIWQLYDIFHLSVVALVCPQDC